MLVNATSAVKETHMSAFEHKKLYEENVEDDHQPDLPDI